MSLSQPRSSLSLFAALALCVGCLYTPRVPIDESRASFLHSPDPVAADAARFFRDPSLARVSLSPDGRKLAGVRSIDGVQALMTIDIDTAAVQSHGALEIDAGKRPSHFAKLGWASSSALLASVESRLAFSGPLPPRKTRLFLAEIDERRPRYVGPRIDVGNPLDVIEKWQQFQDDIIDWLPNDPNAVLVNFKGRAKRFDFRRGRFAEVRGCYMAENVGVQWVADHQGQVRAAFGTRDWGSKYVLYARPNEAEGFHKLAEYDLLSARGLVFTGFSEDPGRIHVLVENEQGRKAVHEYTLPEGPLGPAIFSHPEYDMRGIASSKVDGRLLAVHYDGLKPEGHYVDDGWRRTQAAVDAQLPRRVNRIVDVDLDEKRALVYSAGPQAPPTYQVVDRGDGSLRQIIEALPGIDVSRLSPMRPVEYVARDGLRIPAYLTIPRGQRPQQLPLIVLVHGGPAERVVWGWDPLVQFFASRGFAVFQPNFRGSSGYGRAFREASYRRWGLEMQTDITDGVRWLIAKGVADPERIGIYGRGYGGYAALLEAARQPSLYAASASFGAMTDLLETLADEARAYAGSPDWNHRLIGSRLTDRVALGRASPLQLADRIRAPVLLGHGSDDPRVSVDQLEAMAAALRAAGAEPEVYVYAGELEYFVDERARLDFHTRLGRFFERHLRPASRQALHAQ